MSEPGSAGVLGTAAAIAATIAATSSGVASGEMERNLTGLIGPGS